MKNKNASYVMDTDSEPNLLPPFLFKKTEFVVSEDNPWENDALGRKRQADQLWDIIDAVHQPMVMTLSSPFGMGKTTFLKCWMKQLEKDGVSCVIHNAWEHDYSQDAFAAFVTSIKQQLPNDHKVVERFTESAKRLGGAIIKNSPSFITKVVAKQLIGERGVDALEKFELTEGDAVALAEGIAADTFKAEQDIKDAVDNFRSEFEAIITDKCGGKLIIFVDELDRCRPTYAVEILERIKQIFAVKGAVFVLAVDKQQILNCISGVYGNRLEAGKYFRKFIDWEYSLPSPDLLSYTTHVFEGFFEHEYPQPFIADSGFDDAEKLFVYMIARLAEALDLSLRDIDQYFSYLRLIWRSEPKGASPMALSLTAFFKHVKPSDYLNYINWEIEGDFTKSPIESVLAKILKRHENYIPSPTFSKRVIVEYLIIFFGVQATSGFNSKRCRVPVSSDFFVSNSQESNDIDKEWIVSTLSSARGTVVPSIRRAHGLLEIKQL